ncbi:MAG: DUF6515 family protein [Bacteroidota bacterium]
MKSIYIITLLLLAIVFTFPQELVAQKVVKSRKRTTVVVKKTPRSKVVYVSKRQSNRSIRVMPKGTTTIRHGQTSYYLSDGIYYHRNNSGFVTVKAPVGLSVVSLPVGNSRVAVGSVTYHYAGGSFYRPQANGFVVVQAPLGAQVVGLSKKALKVKIDGKVYYEYRDVIYRKVRVRNGYAYQVAGEIG